MIERETRDFQFWELTSPDDPDFASAYSMLWDTFGATGEMERADVIRSFLAADPFQPNRDGTFIRYFQLVVKNDAGRICGVRDGAVLVNPAYMADLCVVYLSHIVVGPESRGRVASYWLRIAPVEVAVGFLAELGQRGLVSLPQPDRPGAYFGMRIDLAAEVEFFSPDERTSLQRLLFYGRGGFDAIDPAHFPYRQPDFRDPEVIAATGNHPRPFAVLLRRVGRERQATLPIEEALGVMNLLYDEFELHCAPEHLANSLDLVIDRLEARARIKDFVKLLPLPTGPKDLNRLRALFRYKVYSRHYPHDGATQAYLKGPVSEHLKADRRYLDRELAKVREHLEARPAWVSANRTSGWPVDAED